MPVCHSHSFSDLRLQAAGIISAGRDARKAAGLGDDDDWVLPDDGLIDQQAVLLAAQRVRPVKLTPTERLEAATLALAYGATTSEVLQAVSLPPFVRPFTAEVRYLLPVQANLTNTLARKGRMNHAHEPSESPRGKHRHRKSAETASR